MPQTPSFFNPRGLSLYNRLAGQRLSLRSGAAAATQTVGEHKVAIYWTMGVDCGSDSELAAKVARHYDGFVIDLPTFAPVACKAHTETHRDIHFVCVHPRGMGHATFPKSERRPELANDDCESAVRAILYAELHGLLGFRRAMFGAECFDQLVFATPDENSDIDYGFIVFRLELFLRHRIVSVKPSLMATRL